MKKIILLVTAFVSINAFATSIPAARRVSAVEAANAVMHCGSEAQKLANSNYRSEFVKSITVVKKEINSLVSENTYTVNVSAAAGFIGVVNVGILKIVETITQPDARIADKPVDVRWSCKTESAK